MPVAIACPKCQTKYTLPDSALGKSVKCKSCAAVFRTKAPGTQSAGSKSAPAPNQPQSSKPQPSAQELAKLGIDGPLKRQADVFAGTAPPPPQQGNPLGNFVLDDPGFADLNKAKQEVENEYGDDDGMGSILNNPFAPAKAKEKKERKNWGEGDPNYNYRSLSIWAILSSVGIAIEALFWIVAPLVVWGMISSIPEDPETDGEGAIRMLMAPGLTILVIFLAWIINGIFTSIVFWIYLYKANCNVRALGAKGLKNTPASCVYWWFVPIMNTFKPVQVMVEICKATIRPRGTGWEKLPAPNKFNGGWTLYGFGWFPLLIVIFAEIETPWINISLFLLGALLHLIGAVILITVLFDVAKKQNEHALDKYGNI